MNKKTLIPLLIFFLLFSVIALGTPNFVDIGPTTEFTGDAGVPADSAWYIGEYRLDLRVITEWTFTHLEDQLFFGEFAKIEYVRYSNFEATSAPTVNDDTDLGYIVGSLWYDVTADKGYACLDNTNGAAVWIETTSLGHTNLTSFVDQTAWRLFYSNTDGDVVELPLGTAGKYLKSTGATSAPEFDDPAGTTSFTGLTDTPVSYTGKGGKFVKVNVGEDALVFSVVTGEANTASNIGFVADETTAKIYKQKTGVDLELRSLKEGTAIEFIWVSDSGLKENNTASNGFTDVYGTGWKGQYWTATSSYTIDNIQALLYKVGTGNTVTIYVYAADGSGFPTGGELGSKTVDCTGITTNSAGEWITFDLSADSISITDTNKYVWYLVATGGDSGNNTAMRRQETDVLANAFYVYATNSGANWYSVGTFDMAFKVYAAVSYYDYVEIGVVPSEIAEDIGGLLSATTVAFNSDADTTLYTVPTGKRCVLFHAVIVAAGDAGATTTVSIGQNTAETDFVPANTLSNLDAEYDSVILMPIPNTTPLKIKSYAADTVIEVQVASQSGVAGNTIYLFGILY